MFKGLLQHPLGENTKHMPSMLFGCVNIGDRLCFLRSDLAGLGEELVVKLLAL